MYDALKEECLKANLLLPEYQLVDMTFGNVSVIDRDAGVLAIKPSGVDYANMQADDMVLVDLEGKRVAGKMNPSSDTPTHVRLYQVFDQIGAIVHTHSRYATSFAQALMPIECYGTTHADAFHGAVPITRKLSRTEVEGEYEWETGNVIAERFADLDTAAFPGVLVASHGPFAWGPTGRKAVENALNMEVIAQMAFQTRLLNPGIEATDAYLLDKHHLRKHGKNATYGQGG
ncbi:MAG: L-ribulose-5-phosphate 4-epimerase AraD [Candidatus Sumerlaeota bacterium]